MLRSEKRARSLEKDSWRSLQRNSEFSVENHGPLAWHVRAGRISEAAQKILAAPDRFLEQTTLLKRGSGTTIGGGGGLVLKRYNFRSDRVLKDLFRHSKGLKAYRKAYHLELAGIPTAAALAAAEERHFGLRWRSFFLMTEIAPAQNLRWCVPDRAKLEAAARLIAHLHREGFSHADLKPDNILLDAEERAFIVDVDALCFVGRLSAQQVEADLEPFFRAASEFGDFLRAHRKEFFDRYEAARACSNPSAPYIAPKD